MGVVWEWGSHQPGGPSKFHKAKSLVGGLIVYTLTYLEDVSYTSMVYSPRI